jgi:hypothetical protein
VFADCLLLLLLLLLQTEEPVSSVVLLAQHLEACNLQDFWAATGSCKDTISKGVRRCWSTSGQILLQMLLHVLYVCCWRKYHWQHPALPGELQCVAPKCDACAVQH